LAPTQLLKVVHPFIHTSSTLMMLTFCWSLAKPFTTLHTCFHLLLVHLSLLTSCSADCDRLRWSCQFSSSFLCVPWCMAHVDETSRFQLATFQILWGRYYLQSNALVLVLTDLKSELVIIKSKMHHLIDGNVPFLCNFFFQLSIHSALWCL
jgi:hypothetical protein